MYIQFPYNNSNICIIDNPNAQQHDRSLSWLGTSTSIRSGGVKLVVCALWSCKRFPCVSKMLTLTYIVLLVIISLPLVNPN